LQTAWVIDGIQLDTVIPTAAKEQVSPLHVPAQAATLQDKQQPRQDNLWPCISLADQ
jgi:hypothetical protein